MFVHRSSQTRASRRRGQALVEMALVVTSLLFLTLGLMQFALLANARISLTNLAREGARIAAMRANVTGDPDGTIKQQVVNAAASTPLSDITKEQVDISPPFATRAVDTPVIVTVSYDLSKKLIPGVSFLSGGWSNATASAVMVVQG